MIIVDNLDRCDGWTQSNLWIKSPIRAMQPPRIDTSILREISCWESSILDPHLPQKEGYNCCYFNFKALS